MTTPVWQPGRLYPPGSLVQPSTRPAPVFEEIPNGSFEDGSNGWTLDSAFAVTTGDHFTGTHALEFLGSAGGFHAAPMDTWQAVLPGDTITARCQVQQGASSKGQVGANITIYFVDAAFNPVNPAAWPSGNVVNDASSGAWLPSTVSAVVPAGVAYAKVAIHANRVANNKPLWIDAVEWDYVSRAVPPGLVFRATQATAGYSGATEPTWPNTTGVPVVDNEVTWEGVFTSRVTWQATPVLLSGATEPAWAAQVGANVADGTIIWKAVSLRIEDPKCPNSKIVAKGGGKIYVGDDDIGRYNATGNPRDWSSADDAGFLPVGMNQNRGSNPISLMNLYRKHLVVMTADQFQLWQIDPDPSLNELLDTKEGIGSVYHLAAQPVGDELFYLSNLGVRTVGLSASANNMAAGDIGMPIDPLVQQAMKVADGNATPPLGTYLPSMGQYWLMFPNFPPQALGLSGAIVDGAMGDPVEGGYTASGGVMPYAYSIASGALPGGVTLNPSTGELEGSFTTAGAFNWTVRVTDSLGATVTPLADSVTVGAAVQMVTNLRHYSGPIEAMTVGPANIPWAAGVVIDVVGLAPDGVHLIGADADSAATNRVQFLKFDGTSWVATATPAVLPGFGPTAIDWHPSGDYVALGINAGTTNRVFVYRRDGDTYTKVAQPATIQSSQSVKVKWSPDGTKLACSNSNSGDNVWVYPFDAATGVLGNGKGGAGLSDQTATLAWLPEQSRYLVRGNIQSLSLVDTEGGASLVTVDSVTLPANYSDASTGGAFIDDHTLVTVGAALSTNGPVGLWSINPADGANAITFIGYPTDKTTIAAGAGVSLSKDRRFLAIARNISTQATPYCYEADNGAIAQSTVLPSGATGTIQSVSWRGGF
jgi:hypothetical protein